MNNLKLGICSVTFRGKSAAEVVKTAKKGGVEYIEWGGDVHVTNRAEAQTVKALCDNEWIKISSYGSYFNSLEYDELKWSEICEIASVMNASTIRIWLGKKNSEETEPEEYAVLLENTRKMCDVASGYGLIVSPECHDNTYNNNTDAILKFIRDLGRDNFKTYFQSRYFRMEYDIDRIDRTYEYIQDVHVSYRDLKKEQLFRKKDKYYLDKLIQEFKSRNFDGIVMIEFVEEDSETSFLIDVEKLRSI